MPDTDYLNNYWVKVPYLSHKQFFMTKQGLKTFIISCGENEFSPSFFRYYGFEETTRRLKAIGYTFSHKLR